MVITVAFLTSLYILFIVIIFLGWKSALRHKSDPEHSQKVHHISVLIPVRNEESNIEPMLEAITRQNFDRFEIIVIDDHSVDRTVEIVKKIGARVQLIHNHGVGKKKALTQGVVHAKGDIIVTIDADCIAGPQWLKQINNCFSQSDTQMLIGPVTIQNDSTVFTRLQQMEFASLIGSGAATLALGFPTLCNGANLAFRKSAFEKVNGYEGNFHVASGDDEFLMRKIHHAYKKTITFMAASEGIVETRAQPDLKSFFHQRLRWASKWRHNGSPAALMLAFFVAAAQVATLGCTFGFFISGKILWLVFPLVKLVMNAALLARFFRFLKIRWSLPAFLLLELVYPFYVIVTAIAATFRAYQWKGRRY